MLYQEKIREQIINACKQEIERRAKSILLDFDADDIISVDEEEFTVVWLRRHKNPLYDENDADCGISEYSDVMWGEFTDIIHAGKDYDWRDDGRIVLENNGEFGQMYFVPKVRVCCRAPFLVMLVDKCGNVIKTRM